MLGGNGEAVYEVSMLGEEVVCEKAVCEVSVLGSGSILAAFGIGLPPPIRHPWPIANFPNSRANQSIGSK